MSIQHPSSLSLPERVLTSYSWTWERHWPRTLHIFLARVFILNIKTFKHLLSLLVYLQNHLHSQSSYFCWKDKAKPSDRLANWASYLGRVLVPGFHRLHYPYAVPLFQERHDRDDPENDDDEKDQYLVHLDQVPQRLPLVFFWWAHVEIYVCVIQCCSVLIRSTMKSWQRVHYDYFNIIPPNSK